MAVVGMIVHLGRASASAQARELADGLIADGHAVRAPHEDAETAGLDGVEIRDGADFADGLDLVVALGGDGSMLRAIELVEPRSVVGKSTVESIQSGTVFGFAAMIDGMVGRFGDALGEINVVATGGLAHLIAPVSETIEHVEPFLTLHGLRIVHDRNN